MIVDLMPFGLSEYRKSFEKTNEENQSAVLRKEGFNILSFNKCSREVHVQTEHIIFFRR